MSRLFLELIDIGHIHHVEPHPYPRIRTHDAPIRPPCAYWAGISDADSQAVCSRSVPINFTPCRAREEAIAIEIAKNLRDQVRSGCVFHAGALVHAEAWWREAWHSHIGTKASCSQPSRRRRACVHVCVLQVMWCQRKNPVTHYYACAEIVEKYMKIINVRSNTYVHTHIHVYSLRHTWLRGCLLDLSVGRVPWGQPVKRIEGGKGSTCVCRA
jgi:hypothetical protein